MDLCTHYLGLRLPHPLVVGASPICDDPDLVRRAVDAGAAAIVMHSLFEEQIELEMATFEALAEHGHSVAEAQSYLPAAADWVLGPDAYLEQIRKLKSTVQVPIIASLNGTSAAGWLHYAKLIEEAGADALELNIYNVAHDPALTSVHIEDELVAIVQHVAQTTRLPLAVKLSPFWTSLTQLVLRLERAGARGVVLFNRFLQPDIDPERLDVSLHLRLSDSRELLLRLRWLALLAGRTQLSLGVTGGVHSGVDALKAVLTGADCVQMVSALLQRGPEHLGVVRKELELWLLEHEYESLSQAHASLSLERSPQPEVYERGNYLRILQGYSRRLPREIPPAPLFRENPC